MKFKLVESIDDRLVEAKNELDAIKGIIFKPINQLNSEIFIEFRESFKIFKLKDSDAYTVFMILRYPNLSKTHSSLQQWLENNKIMTVKKSFYTFIYNKNDDKVDLDMTSDDDYLNFGDELSEAARMYFDSLN